MNTPNWDNKDKRISFLSVFSTIVGDKGLDVNSLDAGDQPIQELIAYEIVERLFKTYDTTPTSKSVKVTLPDDSPDPQSAPKKKLYPKVCGSCGKNFNTSYERVKNCWDCKNLQ